MIDGPWAIYNYRSIITGVHNVRTVRKEYSFLTVLTLWTPDNNDGQTLKITHFTPLRLHVQGVIDYYHYLF